MGSPISIRADELGYELVARVGTVRRAIHAASVHAAKKWVTLLIQRHDHADKVDTGLHRDAWRVLDTPHGATVENNAPYAGIIERGARPHPVSQEGIDNITGWAMRKLGLDPKAARSAAYAIAAKIRKYGQKGTYIVRDSIPDRDRILRQETEREIRRQASRRAGSR